MSDLKFNKIMEDDMNLDVQGQWCYDRCVHSAHWVNVASGFKPVYGCVYKDDYRDAEGAVLVFF